MASSTCEGLGAIGISPVCARHRGATGQKCVRELSTNKDGLYAPMAVRELACPARATSGVGSGGGDFRRTLSTLAANSAFFCATSACAASSPFIADCSSTASHAAAACSMPCSAAGAKIRPGRGRPLLEIELCVASWLDADVGPRLGRTARRRLCRPSVRRHDDLLPRLGRLLQRDLLGHHVRLPVGRRIAVRAAARHSLVRLWRPTRVAALAHQVVLHARPEAGAIDNTAQLYGPRRQRLDRLHWRRSQAPR